MTGVAGSSAYDTERSARLAPGESLAVGGYTLRYRGTIERPAQNARELRAIVDVERDGRFLGRYEPGKNYYPVEQQVSSEPAIRSDGRTFEDLFLILDGANADGSAQLTALVKPLVNLIWIAGFVFLGGALIALWPDPVEERRLRERYALQLA
jgi:cytochrome c-type biogenesis protein CcmF